MYIIAITTTLSFDNILCQKKKGGKSTYNYIQSEAKFKENANSISL